MKVAVVAVGRPGRLLRPAIAEYERRAARYWSLETYEVREEKASRVADEAEIRAAETRRLLGRVPEGLRAAALTRLGDAWSSTELARRLSDLAVHALPGIAFLVGGAYGLDLRELPRSTLRISLGPATLPHELARLVLAEQLYRAGTIVRGEPYHKG